MSVSTQPGNWVANVWRFVRPPDSAPDEFCELCGVPIDASHPHLAEPAKHRLLCVCRGCATLLGESESGSYRRVPEYVQRLENFIMTDAEWEALSIPIGLAFFVHSTAQSRIAAFYPGPAGPMESLLDLRGWTELAANNPVLAHLQPDVEALLVNRVKGARDYYRVPIDRCYALAGLIRKHWRGLSGGNEAWEAIDGFFSGLCARRESAGACPHG